jgi:hypothetical protein
LWKQHDLFALVLQSQNIHFKLSFVFLSPCPVIFLSQDKPNRLSELLREILKGKALLLADLPCSLSLSCFVIDSTLKAEQLMPFFHLVLKC